jgi:endonuclease YncB( thermonuclease family)
MATSKTKSTKEFVGELRVTGEIDLKQFWPGGKSDGDTVVVKVDAASFTFSPDPKSKPFRRTNVFAGATLNAKPVIKKGGKLTVRLQGIDTTELHYRDYSNQIGPKGNVEYRQFLSETAAVELHDFVAGAGAKATVPCMVTTRVDKPNQVFDVYARFIGDVLVTKAGKQVDVNRWLVRQGWALPAFYDTMRAEEIRAILRAVKAGKAAAGATKRVWGQLAGHLTQLDTELRYRADGPPDPVKDVGLIMMPKLFRRQVLFAISILNNKFAGNFTQYLAKKKKPPDTWLRAAAFLKNRRAKRDPNLSTVLDGQGQILLAPDEIVFAEQQGPDVKGPNGRALTRF